MNLSDKWIAADMASILCEVITYLREDPHYSKEDAVKDLKKLFPYIDQLYQRET